MTEEDLIREIENIRVCINGDKRAPQKPLLLLLSLAMLQQNSPRLFCYEEVKGKLGDLLKEFGPRVKTRHSTKDPFLRLCTNNFWEVDKEFDLDKYSKSSDKYLIENNVSGGFTTEAHNLLKSNPKLIKTLTKKLLENHFFETLHDDILTRVGLRFDYISLQKRRDPIFREKVLIAYENKCAICGFDVKLRNIPLALEAAHIKWYKVGGPDIEKNGLLLCVMHHKLFDQGAFTLNKSKEVIVSKNLNGTSGLREWLIQFNGKKIHEPIINEYQPNYSYINWHGREVFKG